LFHLLLNFLSKNPEKNVVIQRDAQFDVTYDDTVTSDNQTIYSYNHTVSRNKTEGVRVSVELLSESAQSPVLFVVRQKQAVLSFQVPLILRGLYQRKYQYTQVGRTLCQPPTKALAETQFFYLDVSTLSSAGVHYQLRVSRVDSFTLQTDKKFSFNATPSQPHFFKYMFPDGVDTVIVKVNSQKNFPCSVMSIQDIQCPVYDLDNNVAFIGMYQTMTTTAAITVQRKDFPSNSFYVVVVVKTEDEACGGPLRFYPVTLPQPIRAQGYSTAANQSAALLYRSQSERRVTLLQPIRAQRSSSAANQSTALLYRSQSERRPTPPQPIRAQHYSTAANQSTRLLYRSQLERRVTVPQPIRAQRYSTAANQSAGLLYRSQLEHRVTLPQPIRERGYSTAAN
uniref:SID1 transmembrane family member 2 n=1 Tax=Cyprinus carpio TaxID=7962 RepID=A0A8C2BT43_CYPCA